MTLIADLFPKLRTPKNKLKSMSKKSRFKGSFPKQHGKRAQTLLKFPCQHLYHIYRSFSMQLSWKKSLLVICKILRLFPNTLSADIKYSLFKRDNLTQPIQMQVIRKQNFFLNFLLHFSNLAEISNTFLKNMTLIADVFPELRTQKNLVRSMSIKSHFKGSFPKQHRKRSQTLLKLAWQHLYHIYSSL